VFLELIVIYFAVNESSHFAEVGQVIFVLDVKQFRKDIAPNGFVEVSDGKGTIVIYFEIQRNFSPRQTLETFV
jgi:hypothetical protein